MGMVMSRRRQTEAAKAKPQAAKPVEEKKPEPRTKISPKKKEE